MDSAPKIGQPRSRYLVFTCAGDRSNLHHWLTGHRNFDLWVTYYGDQGERYREVADFYNVHKGKKFPNLWAVHRRWNDLFASYDAVFVVDDDIVISGSDISRLFEIRKAYDLWLLQPAFHPQGKIGHPITCVRPYNTIRFTNFVEVTCPLFRKDKLDVFMGIYDPVVVGWGVDWWFLDVLGPDLEGKVAVVDAISCINPRDRVKGRHREVDQPQYAMYAKEHQKRAWEEVRRRLNIQSQSRGYKEYASIKSPFVRDYLATITLLPDLFPLIRRSLRARAARSIRLIRERLSHLRQIACF